MCVLRDDVVGDDSHTGRQENEREGRRNGGCWGVRKEGQLNYAVWLSFLKERFEFWIRGCARVFGAGMRLGGRKEGDEGFGECGFFFFRTQSPLFF